MKNKLNLGCGEFKKDGYVNVDCFSVSEPDVTHDLNSFPYPFEDNSFLVVEADHLLEHLDDPFMVMRELYRISADGCQIKLRMPHFSRGFTHSQHRRGFDVSFPLYFDPTFPGGYQGVPLKLENMTLRWFAQPYLKKRVLPPLFYFGGRTLGRVIDFFANLSPFVCSRLWCFWVGGFEEIEIVFRVEKKS
ncbi:MAG: methyltransferase type 11 [Candidatus Riflebacteria bacterium HGW-Riflebacteria-2]|jgi:SAM-dependent methyltransferase|nr:MAG: methyltransferase type 11 [Candidatus Riflebacteria bacterium HGW-Riflebacteria-2]